MDGEHGDGDSLASQLSRVEEGGGSRCAGRRTKVPRVRTGPGFSRFSRRLHGSHRCNEFESDDGPMSPIKEETTARLQERSAAESVNILVPPLKEVIVAVAELTPQEYLLLPSVKNLDFFRTFLSGRPAAETISASFLSKVAFVSIKLGTSLSYVDVARIKLQKCTLYFPTMSSSILICALPIHSVCDLFLCFIWEVML